MKLTLKKRILPFLAGLWAVLLFCPAIQAVTNSISLDGVWKIKIDPNNEGKNAQWWTSPLADASDIPVPGVIQQVFYDYHGVVWYDRTFETPANPNEFAGRYLLRFWQAEYYCEVWLNNQFLGAHEGGEAMFELDATEVMNPVGESNRLTVRIINPTDEPIDGFSLSTIPRRNNTNVITAGCGFASGGLVDSVELLCVPAVRIVDLHLIPNWKTGEIVVDATFENTSKQAQSGSLTLSAALATGNEMTLPVKSEATVEPGISTVRASVTVPDFKLWNLNDPNLYNVVAQWNNATLPDSDQKIARCGFRDFRFENGYFRLNGKRIYLKCSHSGSDSPITHRLPLDPDLYRKDILFCKAMNFNMIRYIAGMPRRFQLDLCDEIGFMVYDECLAGWMLGDSPYRTERLYRQTEGMILRDRNHPCVTIWGLLNENFEPLNVLDSAAFLPRARELDPDRMIILNSGNFDQFVPGKPSETADFSAWYRKDATLMPAIIKNFKPTFFRGGTDWLTNTFCLHPGDVTSEYTVVKWAAPADGVYDLTAKFSDIVVHGVATVDLHIYRGNESVFDSFLNLNGIGKVSEFSDQLTLQKGEELSFVVGIGDGAGTGDTTALDLQIKDQEGNVFDVNKDYSFEKNPNGPWSYGYIKAGKTPELAAFKLFDAGQETFCLVPKSIGRFANPGVDEWQDGMADTHPYQAVPQTLTVINNLRQHNPRNSMPVFLSEYGIGSGVDLFRLTRLFEQNHAVNAADAKHYRWRYDNFMNDWNAWGLNDTFASEADYFQRVLAWMAEQRRLGINALRANPLVIAHSVTGTHDQGISGEGLTTLFREFKPGTLETMADLFAPLRFCLFVEPVHLYKGQTAKFEAVLVNEDILKPGQYPVRYQIVGPNNTRVYDKVATLVIPEPADGAENPIVLPAFAEDIAIDGPSGEYKFTATFLENAAACGGWERFFVSSRDEMPKLQSQYVVWGNDEDLLNKLASVQINAVPFTNAEGNNVELTKDSIVLVGANVNQMANPESFAALFNAVKEKGCSVVFLSMNVLNDGQSATGFLPFDQKGDFPSIRGTGWNWLYHKDDWNKRHAFFDNMPCGDLLDYCYYREIAPPNTFKGQPIPDEIVAGAFNTTEGYGSGLTLVVYHFGKGRFVLNTFRILESLSTDPAAEHLLRNILANLPQ